MSPGSGGGRVQWWGLGGGGSQPDVMSEWRCVCVCVWTNINNLTKRETTVQSEALEDEDDEDVMTMTTIKMKSVKS